MPLQQLTGQYIGQLRGPPKRTVRPSPRTVQPMYNFQRHFLGKVDLYTNIECFAVSREEHIWFIYQLFPISKHLDWSSQSPTTPRAVVAPPTP